MNIPKLGAVVEAGPVLARVWRVLPVAGSSELGLVCTTPDPLGGWEGPGVLVPLDETVIVLEGDLAALAKLKQCTRCGHFRARVARRMCNPCNVFTRRSGAHVEFPRLDEPQRELAGVA